MEDKKSIDDRVVGGNQSLNSICAAYCGFDVKACYMSVMACPYYVSAVGRKFKFKYKKGVGV